MWSSDLNQSKQIGNLQTAQLLKQNFPIQEIFAALRPPQTETCKEPTLAEQNRSCLNSKI